MTMRDLKQRYETQTKLTKPAKRAIKAQLSRECTVKGCHNSLAFQMQKRVICDNHKTTRAVTGVVKVSVCKYVECDNECAGSRMFCCFEHRQKQETHVRKLNRAKKAAYNKRHGLGRTTPRKTIVKSIGVDPIGYELVYDNYKEPLRKVEKGYGFMGCLAQTKDNMYIQCHICGDLFQSLAHHVAKGHKIPVRTYKDKYGLAATTALVAETMRTNLATRNNIGNKELPEHLKQYNLAVQSGKIRHPGTKARHGGLPLEKRNELGICPDQVLQKIKDAAQILGHTPSLEEFIKLYKHRYVHSINTHFGTYLKAVAAANLVSARDLMFPTKEQLLDKLIQFKEKYGRSPLTSDFNRGFLPPRQAYWRHFGSLNNARVEAGLSAMIPLTYGKYAEIPAEEYKAMQTK